MVLGVIWTRAAIAEVRWVHAAGAGGSSPAMGTALLGHTHI